MRLALAPRLQIAPDTHRKQRSARLEFGVPCVLDEHLAHVQHPIMLAALPANARGLDLDAMAHAAGPGRPQAWRRACISAGSLSHGFFLNFRCNRSWAWAMTLAM